MSPRYLHDCDCCAFLGRDGKLDLYACEGGDLSYIARYGDDGADYRSLPAEVVRSHGDGSLIEAMLRHTHPEHMEAARASASASLALVQTLDHIGAPKLDAPVEERRGHCYELALRAFIERPHKLVEGDSVKLTLVHGFPRLQTTGQRFGHAWVEVETTTRLPAELQSGGWPPTLTTTLCYDPITDTMLLAPLYYHVGRIYPPHTNRWETAQEALDAMLDHGAIGSWGDESGLDEAALFLERE